jgi:hypothetical protein
MRKNNFKIFILCILFLLLISISVSAFNISDCEREEKEWMVQECYSRVAIINNDLDLCKKSGDYEGNCYYKIGLNLNDSSFCEYADKFRYECYTNIFLKINDTSICETAVDVDKCFNELYEETKDKRFCEYLIDKPIDCLCAEDEFLENDDCVKLQCENDEVAKDHICEKICKDNYDYKKGKCIYRCEYGYSSNSDGTGCGRNAVVWTLTYLSKDLPILFIIFVIFVLFFMLKPIRKMVSLVKKDSIIEGIKYVFIFTDILIVLFLFSDRPYFLIEAFEHLYSLINLFLLFVVPFFIGIITYLVKGFIERKDYKYKRIFENLVLSLGIVIFIGFLKTVLPSTLMENLAPHLIMYLFYLVGKSFLFNIYTYLISSFIYYWIILFLLVSFSRHLYELILKRISTTINKKLPVFIKETVFYSLLFLPFLVLILPSLPFISQIIARSLGDFPDLFFYLVSEEMISKIPINFNSIYTRTYYSLVIYSVIWSVVFILAKRFTGYVWRKFKR